MRLRLLPIVIAAAPAALAAQGTAVRAGPQYVSYTIGGSVDRTISQFAVPIAVILPVTSKFSIDIGTAFATSTVTSGGGSSSISGLTDTQIRANYAFGANVILTIGLNAPTGKSTLDPTQVVAASLVGSDLLGFPVPSMGTGFAATAGLAVAGDAGEWTLSAGASMRKATQYQPFSDTTGGANYKFTPGDEYRVRVGADRAAGGGHVSLGMSYSAFGSDLAQTATPTTYSTGNRLLSQALYARPLGDGGKEFFLTMWDLYTSEGQLLGGLAPSQNIFNLGAALALHKGDLVFEPNLEGRLWSRTGGGGFIGSGGLRLRIPAGNFIVYPGAAASFGSLTDPGTSSSASFSGYRASLTIHWVP